MSRTINTQEQKSVRSLRSSNFKKFQKKVVNRLWEIATSVQDTIVTEIPTTRPWLRGQESSFFALKWEKNLNVSKAWFEGVRRRSRQNAMGGLLDDEASKSLLVSDYEQDLDQACHIVLTLWSAAKSHFPRKLRWVDHEESLVGSAILWLQSCDEQQDFIPFLKYQLSYLFAIGERQAELPERPKNLFHKDGMLLLGYAGKLMKLKIFGKSLQRKAWRNTVLHGIKKGLPQMGPSRLAAAAAGMKNRLTDFQTSPDCALAEISRTSREVFGKGIGEKEWNKPAKAWTSLTGNACFENSRGKGGAIGYLRWEDGGWDCDDASRSCLNPSLRLGFEQFRGMVYFPRMSRTESIFFPAWTYENVYDEWRRKSLQSLDVPGSAQVSLIREPLKARSISAGDIKSNCVFSDLQKKMWRKLQGFKQFELTGRWVDTTDLMDIDSETERFEPRFRNWVSGDYSAATDSLHGDATIAAATSCSSDEVTKKVLLRGLTNTQICFDKLADEYPEVEWPENFTMTRGQLMGCVFSFPLLCVINIAMYRAALEERLGRKFKICELPVRVNGDDILFKADEQLYRIWESKISQVGFQKSVGKNYFSENFAIINSVYFDVTDGVRYVPYLNLGWCTGVAKGSNDDSEKDLYRIRAQMDEVEKYLKPFPELSETLREFKQQVFHWNEKQIKASCLPLDRGLMGLNLSDDHSTCGIYDEFRYYLAQNLEKPVSHGYKACPKTMAPWKVTTGGSKPNDYRAYFREFLGFKKSVESWKELPFAPRVTKTFVEATRWEGVMRMIRSEISSGLTEWKQGHASFGIIAA